ncbi:MAG: hypothetical protein KAR35_01485 [Candidatus Heimdallarchaeota archaeon]|nr:hypothetical protein [Candidatus Heimdallarchaeota archaeon]MCK5048028.1 hypothetical protein [Candidatus Heimdallarchaeota archaeon]
MSLTPSRYSETAPPTKKWFEIILAVIISIIYASSKILMSNSEIVSYFSEDIRPVIFLLAFVSSAFGPLVGGIVGGLGTLFYALANYLIDSKNTMDSGSMVELLGNSIAGIVTGTLSTRFFEDGYLKSNRLRDAFKFDTIIKIIRNTLASVIGFGLTMGLIIGFGIPLIEGNPIELGLYDNANNELGQFILIFYWNSIFLLFFMPIVEFCYVLGLAYSSKRKEKELSIRREVMLVNETGDLIEITSHGLVEGMELVVKSWGSVKFEVKNQSTQPGKFRIEYLSEDVIKPAVDYTTFLNPGETDIKYLQIYPVSSGVRSVSMIIKPWLDQVKKLNEFPNIENEQDLYSTATFEYVVARSDEVIKSRFSAFILLSTLIIGLMISFYQFFVQAEEISYSLIVGTLIGAIELGAIIIYYFYQRHGINKLLPRSVSLSALWTTWTDSTEGQIDDRYFMSKEEIEQEFLKNFTNAQSQVKRWYPIFYLLILIDIIFGVILVSTVLDYHNVNSNEMANFDNVINIILMGTLVLIFSWFVSLIDKNVLDLPQRIKKSYKIDLMAEESPLLEVNPLGSFIKDKGVQLNLVVSNISPSYGLRCRFHSIDHITPSSVDILCKSGEIESFNVLITPLKEGSRNISVEFAPLYDKKGNLIRAEDADQLMVKTFSYKVKGSVFYGLTLAQISLLKKVLTLTGFSFIGLTIISRIIDQNLHDTIYSSMLPVFIILQVPILFIYFALLNNLKKHSEEY